MPGGVWVNAFIIAVYKQNPDIRCVKNPIPTFPEISHVGEKKKECSVDTPTIFWSVQSESQVTYPRGIIVAVSKLEVLRQIKGTHFSPRHRDRKELSRVGQCQIQFKLLKTISMENHNKMKTL